MKVKKGKEKLSGKNKVRKIKNGESQGNAAVAKEEEEEVKVKG